MKTSPFDPSAYVETFTLMQFNVLADGLCGRMSFPHGGFTQLLPEEADWKNRKNRLLEEIATHAPDILTLQEVDHFDDWFVPQLARMGYVGLYMPKSSSPCLHYSERPDGCALFYKSSRFLLLRHLEGELKAANGTTLLHRDDRPCHHGYILAHLKACRSKKEVVVATSHFTASKPPLGEDTRLEEAKSLSRAIRAFTNDEKAAVLIGIDMNAVPKQLGNLPAKVYPGFRRQGYKSAYGVDGADTEPPYTTWKLRGDYEAKMTIDYILYKNLPAPLAKLSIPLEHEIAPQRLPGAKYPSDHFAIMAEFGFSA
jgi:mRNA deadenylase 3'-5' endonuclease subunit Ccr4